VLGQIVTMCEDGIERQVTIAEAFMLKLMQRGLKVTVPPPVLPLPAIEDARKQQDVGEFKISAIVILAAGSPPLALEPLRMARKLNRYRETARMALEPSLVGAALARLDRKFSPAEQRVIVHATRTSREVRWPEWWSEYP
jgi:hypothetical protein